MAGVNPTGKGVKTNSNTTKSGGAKNAAVQKEHETLFEDKVKQAKNDLTTLDTSKFTDESKAKYELAKTIIDKIDFKDTNVFNNASVADLKTLAVRLASQMKASEKLKAEGKTHTDFADIASMDKITEVDYDPSKKTTKIYDTPKTDSKDSKDDRFYLNIDGTKGITSAVTNKIDNVYVGGENNTHLKDADVKFTKDGKVSQFSADGTKVDYTYDKDETKETITDDSGKIESDVYKSYTPSERKDLKLDTANKNKDYVPGLQATGNSKFQGKLVSQSSYSQEDIAKLEQSNKNVSDNGADIDVHSLLKDSAQTNYTKLDLADQNAVQDYIIQAQKISGGKWDAVKAVNNILKDGFDPKVLNLKKGASLTDMLNRSLKYLNETYDKDLTYYDSSKGRITLDSNDSGDIVNYDSKNGREIL